MTGIFKGGEPMNKEQWKPVQVKGFEGLYEVSSYGRVRSLARTIKASDRIVNYKTRVLKQNIDSGGYAQVTLCNHTKRKTIGVHVLVAEAFIGKRPKGLDICHNDGKATHNHPHNLRWASRSENCKDKTIHGTHNFLKEYIARDKANFRELSKRDSSLFMQGACSVDSFKDVRSA